MPYARIFTAIAVGLACCGCSRHTPESRIKSVEARIDGITCPTCVPPLTKSLQKQFQKSNVEVDDDKDTATVQFADGESFSPGDFKAAVERVRMRVVSVRAQACGTVESADGKQWLTAGSSRFVVQSDQPLPIKQPLCVDGTIDTKADPSVFEVSAFSAQSPAGS